MTAITPYRLDRRFAGVIVCPACNAVLQDEDFPGAGEFGHEQALLDRYGYMPCSGCCDDHTTCRSTGEAIRRSEAHHDMDGETYATEEAALEADAEIRGWTRHIAAEQAFVRRA